MYIVNDEQLELMVHMAENNNLFGTEDDSAEECYLDKLVEQGLAIKMRAPNWMIDDVLFRLTDEGVQWLQNGDQYIATCPKCERPYRMGHTGTVDGCDECLGNVRDADGYVYGPDEAFIELENIYTGETEIRQRPE